MKKNINIVLVALALTASACSVSAPIAVTDNPVGSKVGTAKKKCIFNICGFNVNVGVQEAAKNGGITKVATVDFKIKAGLFSKTYETIVTGE